jgi:A/G-specific adenine glycosylase
MTPFAARLLNWFSRHKRDLPWRHTRNIYRIWVSEVMLQQTQIATVIPYYARFLKRFPTLNSLARAGEQDVLKMWEGLGYYGRARQLWRAARIVVRTHRGRIPHTPERFATLPGVGPYINAAVMSIACGHPLPAVDGNVLRVVARYAGIFSDLRSPALRSKTHAFVRRMIPADRPGEFNEAMMELGAVVCTPRAPRCGRCPLRPGCVARRAGRTADLPRRSRKPPIPLWRVSAAVILRSGRIFIQQRPSHGLLGGLWEFPGGKARRGETAEQALRRECREELGAKLIIIGRLRPVRHSYSHFRIVMTVFLCRLKPGRLRTPLPFRWITLHELDDYPFPAADRKFFPELRVALPALSIPTLTNRHSKLRSSSADSSKPR